MSVIIGKVGLSTNLDSAPIENGFKYTEDTGELYLDYGSGDDVKRVRVNAQLFLVTPDTTYNDIYSMLTKLETGGRPFAEVYITTKIDTDDNAVNDTTVNGFATLSLDYIDYTYINLSIQSGDWVFKETLAMTLDTGGPVPDTSDEKWQHTLAQSTTKFRISDFASQIATAAAFSTKYATMLDIIGNHK